MNERLKEMKGLVSTWVTILKDGNFPDITSDEVNHVIWFIQQAEQKQELEKQVKRHKEEKYSCMKKKQKLEQENQRLKQQIARNID